MSSSRRPSMRGTPRSTSRAARERAVDRVDHERDEHPEQRRARGAARRLEQRREADRGAARGEQRAPPHASARAASSRSREAVGVGCARHRGAGLARFAESVREVAMPAEPPEGRRDRPPLAPRARAGDGRGAAPGQRLLPHHERRRRAQLGAQVLDVPLPVRDGLLRHGVHVGGRPALRPRPLRLRAAALLAAPGRPDDGGRHDHAPAGADPEEGLRPDGGAEVGDGVRRLHLLGRPLQQLRGGAGHRHHHPGRHLRARLPAAARGGARRPDQAPGARAGREGRAATGRHHETAELPVARWKSRSREAQ